MLYEWLAIAMFAGFFVLLMTGYPVAFSFAGTAFIFGAIGLAVGAFNLDLLRALPNRWFGTMSDFTLLAIPFFIYLGAVLEKSGLAEELLETVGILLGPLRGGIALAVVIVGTLLAATTGVVAATVIAMGMITLPVMLRYGYDKELATGVITASGTLAQMIPPSLVLVVLSDQIGVSVGDLFRRRADPRPDALGLLCALLRGDRIYQAKLCAGPTAGGTLVARYGAGAQSHAGAHSADCADPGGAWQYLFRHRNANRGWRGRGGWCSDPGGGQPAILLEVVARCRRQYAPHNRAGDHHPVLLDILFAGFRRVRRHELDHRLLTSLPGGTVAFMIVSNIVVFLLGIFLEFVEICFIVMPLFVPAATLLGIDMVWFAVVMAINLQTAFISPPVGFSLFYLQSVAPKEVKTIQIHRGAIPFMIIQLIILIVVMIFPQTVTWLVVQSGG